MVACIGIFNVFGGDFQNAFYTAAVRKKLTRFNKDYTMKKRFASHLMALCFVWGGMAISMQAQAQTDASALSTLSALPLVSVVVGSEKAAEALVALPAALSETGAMLVVKTVQSTARGTVYVLERASDGARASIEVSGQALAQGSLAVGASVQVTVLGSGLVLSAAGQAIALIPNALGRALLHNERLTNTTPGNRS